jgi:transcriptional regulator NrdR family protein
MLCPLCNSRSKVWDTRAYFDQEKSFNYVERKQECLECDHRFITIEVTVDIWDAQTNASEPQESTEV